MTREEVMYMYNGELREIEAQCEAEGLPTRGSTFDLRAEAVAAQYREMFPEAFESEWELVDVKDVQDWDGFWTEYALYCNGVQFVCIFGDTEIYTPDTISEWDWDFETEDAIEAYEWFESFTGFEDEE